MQLLPLFNTEVIEDLKTATFNPFLTNEQCDNIIADFTVEEPITATIANKIENAKKRDTLVHPIPYTEDSDYLFKMIADRVARINMLYDFDVSGIYSDLQLLEYGVDDHYDWHMDIGPGLAALRKLSVIIQLSGPDDYEGGEVMFNTGTEFTLPPERGQIAVFPSYVMHKVNPITEGKRYSLVCWVSGQRRMR